MIFSSTVTAFSGRLWTPSLCRSLRQVPARIYNQVVDMDVLAIDAVVAHYLEVGGSGDEQDHGT